MFGRKKKRLAGPWPEDKEDLHRLVKGVMLSDRYPSRYTSTEMAQAIWDAGYRKQEKP